MGETTNACEEFAALVDRLAAEGPSPRELMERIGQDGARIRTGPAGLMDLARGGRNMISGKGFRADLDDGTDGQVRHFAGIVASVGRVGGSMTRIVSEKVRKDPAESPDGRLSEAAIAFSGLLLSGQLAVAEAGAWVRQNLGAPVTQG